MMLMALKALFSGVKRESPISFTHKAGKNCANFNFVWDWLSKVKNG